MATPHLVEGAFQEMKALLTVAMDLFGIQVFGQNWFDMCLATALPRKGREKGKRQRHFFFAGPGKAASERNLTGDALAKCVRQTYLETQFCYLCLSDYVF